MLLELGFLCDIQVICSMASVFWTLESGRTLNVDEFYHDRATDSLVCSPHLHFLNPPTSLLLDIPVHSLSTKHVLRKPACPVLIVALLFDTPSIFDCDAIASLSIVPAVPLPFDMIDASWSQGPTARQPETLGGQDIRECKPLNTVM